MIHCLYYLLTHANQVNSITTTDTLLTQLRIRRIDGINIAVQIFFLWCFVLGHFVDNSYSNSVELVNTLLVVDGLKKSLFVFLIDDPKQIATSLLTPFSNIVFYALSSGTLGFHGSFNNHLHERI